VNNSFFGNNNANGNGGVVYNYGNFKIFNSIFEGNNASKGSVVYNFGRDFIVVNSTFKGNHAISKGAIYNFGVNFTVKNSTFTSNGAVNGSCIYNYYGTFNVINSNFTSNTGTGYGGVISTYYGDFSISGSNFTNNTAHRGGAIYCRGFYSGVVYSVRIDSCNFINNTAGCGGAIYGGSDSSCSIVHSNFTGNLANETSGGAIETLMGSRFSVSNSNFKDNSATDEGGAIHSHSLSFNLTNCNFTSNKATRGSVIDNGGTLLLSGNVMNDTVEGVSMIYNDGGTISNLKLTYFAHVISARYGLYNLIANLTDDMGHPITGGTVRFDLYSGGALKYTYDAEVIDGQANLTAQINKNEGYYVLRGGYSGAGRNITITPADIIIDGIEVNSPTISGLRSGILHVSWCFLFSKHLHSLKGFI